MEVTQEKKSYRLLFVILAMAWLAILLPLIYAMIQNPQDATQPAVIFALVISIMSTVGAIATIFYKSWGVTLFFTASLVLIGDTVSRWLHGSSDSFPWDIILITVFYAGCVYNSRHRFMSGTIMTPGDSAQAQDL